MCKKIRELPSFEMSDSILISGKVQEGPWTEDQKRTLGVEIESRLSLGNSVQSQSPDKKNQRFMLVENLLTEEDWRVFDDPKIPMEVKTSRICFRCRKIGLVKADEHTYGRLAKILGSRVPGGLTVLQLHNLVNSLKVALHAEAHSFPYPFPLQRTVNHPAELGPAAYEYAYSDSSPVPPPPGLQDALNANKAKILRTSSGVIKTAVQGCHPIGSTAQKGVSFAPDVTVVQPITTSPQTLASQVTYAPLKAPHTASSMPPSALAPQVSPFTSGIHQPSVSKGPRRRLRTKTPSTIAGGAPNKIADGSDNIMNDLKKSLKDRMTKPQKGVCSTKKENEEIPGVGSHA